MAVQIKERIVSALIWIVAVAFAVIATAGLLAFCDWITDPYNILTTWSNFLGNTT